MSFNLIEIALNPLKKPIHFTMTAALMAAVAKTNFTHSNWKKATAINVQIKSEPKLAIEPQIEERNTKNGWNVTNFGIRSWFFFHRMH